MQLRDSIPSIIYPGHWGFFAGHCQENENAEAALNRELFEELCWEPKGVSYLGNMLIDKRQVHVHECHLDCSVNELILQEGQEIGVFNKNEIAEKKLYSNILNKKFPISPISQKVFELFILKESDA